MAEVPLNDGADKRMLGGRMGITHPTTSLMERAPAARPEDGHLYRAWIHPTMRAIVRVIAEIGPTEIPVLVLGECGTGKDVVASELHRTSRRRGKSFHKFAGSSVTPGQLDFDDPELEAGTVFLDELGELSAAAQKRLLQTLSRAERSESACLPRLICASSRNLEELMRGGRFPEELFFRLNGVCLRLPPLRQCREDIPGLAQFFLGKYAGMFGRPRPALSALEVRALAEHHWPGNIRELENAMKQAVVLGGEIARLAESGAVPALPAAHWPAEGDEVAKGPSLKEAARAASRQAERELILKALARTRWNRKRAARDLRISYKALLYKLKQIAPEEAAGS